MDGLTAGHGIVSVLGVALERVIPNTQPRLGLQKKAELRLENGEKKFAFIVSRGTKHLLEGANAHVRVFKRHRPELIEDTRLDVALVTHSYGRLVKLNDYKLLNNNDPIWHMPFPENGERLARMLEGLLIQSGDQVLLALKVEIYGTADYEDPHAQDIARPEGMKSFKVANIYHDRTHKVMIGTLKWCLLVTLAVILTDGTVVVGPNNQVFEPKETSSVWMRKELGEHLYNTMARQLRSKFDDMATFAPNSWSSNPH